MTWGLHQKAGSWNVKQLARGPIGLCVLLVSTATAVAGSEPEQDAECATHRSRLGYFVQVGAFWLLTAYFALLLTHMAVGLDQVQTDQQPLSSLPGFDVLCSSVGCASGLLTEVFGLFEDGMQQLVRHTSHPVFCMLAALPAAHVSHTVLQAVAHLAAHWGGLQPMGSGTFGACSALLAILNALILGSLSTHLKAAKVTHVEELLNDLLPAHVSAVMLQQQQQLASSILATQDSITRSSSCISEGAPSKVQSGNPVVSDGARLDGWAANFGAGNSASTGSFLERLSSGCRTPRRSCSMRALAGPPVITLHSKPTTPPTLEGPPFACSPFAAGILHEPLGSPNLSHSVGMSGIAASIEVADALLPSGHSTPNSARASAGVSSLAVSNLLEAMRPSPVRRPASRTASGLLGGGGMSTVEESTAEVSESSIRTTSCNGHVASAGSDSVRRSFQRPSPTARVKGRLSACLPFSPYKASSDNGTLPPAPASPTSWRDKCLSPLRHVLPVEVLGLAASAAVAAMSPPSPRLASAGSAPPLITAPDAPAYVEVHDCVTVLFADISGFTTMAAQCEPEAVMAMLNRLYYGFDEATRSLPVYKVETIGDCYMAACNLVHTDPCHASTMLQYARLMQEYAKTISLPTDPTKHVQLRIGIHSGPCTSGVVGQIRRRYCLFGNTINTASRMESCGIPGRIHISADTYQLLLQQAGAGAAQEWECRGPIAVKGRGDLITYLLAQKVADIRGTSFDSAIVDSSIALERRPSVVLAAAAAAVTSASAALALAANAAACGSGHDDFCSEAIANEIMAEDMTSDVINSDVLTDDMIAAVRAAKVGVCGATVALATATAPSAAVPTVSAVGIFDGIAGGGGADEMLSSTMCLAGDSTASNSADRDTSSSLATFAVTADQARMLMAANTSATALAMPLDATGLGARSLLRPTLTRLEDNVNWSSGGYSSCNNAYNDGPSKCMIDRFFLSGMTEALMEKDDESVSEGASNGKRLVDSYIMVPAAAKKLIATPSAAFSEEQPPGPYVWGLSTFGSSNGHISSSSNGSFAGSSRGRVCSSGSSFGGGGGRAPTIPATPTDGLAQAGSAGVLETLHGGMAEELGRLHGVLE